MITEKNSEENQVKAKKLRQPTLQDNENNLQKAK